VIELFAWLVFIGVLLVAGAVGGVLLAEWLAAHRRRSLDEREAKLQADWKALLTEQRLQAAFMQARRAMWEEAIRARREPGSQ
jgi:hypothetical protein